MNEIAFVGTVLSLVFMAATVLMAIYLWRIAAERGEEEKRLKKIVENFEAVAVDWRDKWAFKCAELDKYKRERKEYEAGFIQANQDLKNANDRLREERRLLKEQVATKSALIASLRCDLAEAAKPVEDEAKLLKRIEMQRIGLVRYWRITRQLQGACDMMKYRTICFEAISLEAAKRGRRIEAQSKALKKFRDRLVDALAKAEAQSVMLDDRQVEIDKLRRDLAEATDVCEATDEGNFNLKRELVEAKQESIRLTTALEAEREELRKVRHHAAAILDPVFSFIDGKEPEANRSFDQVMKRINEGESILSSELRAAGEALRESVPTLDRHDKEAIIGNIHEGFDPSPLLAHYAKVRRASVGASEDSAIHEGDLESRIIDRCGDKLREQAEAEAAKEEAEILFGRPGGDVPSGVFNAKDFREEVFSSFVGKRIAFRGREEGTFLEVCGIGSCKLFTEDDDSGEPMLCVSLDDGSEIYFYPTDAEVVADPEPEGLGVVSGPLPLVGLKIDMEFVGATEFASVKTGPDSVKEIDFVGGSETAERFAAFDEEAFRMAKREAWEKAGVLQKTEFDNDRSGFTVEPAGLIPFPVFPMPADPDAIIPESWTATVGTKEGDEPTPNVVVKRMRFGDAGDELTLQRIKLEASGAFMDNSLVNESAKIIDAINADPKLREGDGEANEAADLSEGSGTADDAQD